MCVCPRFLLIRAAELKNPRSAFWRMPGPHFYRVAGFAASWFMLKLFFFFFFVRTNKSAQIKGNATRWIATKFFSWGTSSTSRTSGLRHAVVKSALESESSQRDSHNHKIRRRKNDAQHFALFSIYLFIYLNDFAANSRSQWWSNQLLQPRHWPPWKRRPALAFVVRFTNHMAKLITWKCLFLLKEDVHFRE